MIAVKALGELGIAQSDIVQLVIGLIESDPDPFIRYKAAQLLVSSPHRLPEEACARLWDFLKCRILSFEHRMMLAFR